MTNDLSGRVIRGYEIQEQIGAGGFGAVYRAFQPILKREVAIKVVLPEYANSPDFIRRFEVEAELVARLEHPYITPLFDYWREPDSAYLVMRLLRGGTLDSLIQSGALPLEQIASILDQISSALHIAHRNGVVHRDIKPGNILLDEDGNAYLADFGIALSKDYESIGGDDEGISGSISHTPPEQLQGGEITPQTDIYALGIILYQMLAGNHPFAESKISEMVFKHLSDPLPDIEREDLAFEINDILQKATEKNSEDRHSDVRELASEFRALISEGNIPPDDEFIFIDLPNPYKGLRAFQEADADQFFGRSALSGRLLDRMAEPVEGARFLAVIGPSGSGKSSVVKAGLLPALRRGGLRGSENWFVVEMFPGISPFTELEAALMRVAVNPVESLIRQINQENGFTAVLNQILPDDNSELVLVIDQFEEIFTQVSDEAVRVRFLNNLVESVLAPRSRLRVIVTMRADFYDKPLQYREFGELLRKRIETVLPMSPDELVETITQPAELVGVGFQAGLVEAISRDVGEQPGMLPLLQYTMTELFDHRQGQILTLTSYQELGGVTGSLARRSEELYSSLDEAGKQATRQLFLRLVSPGEGTEDTRRRVRSSELATTDEIGNVIALYGGYRLLTFDKDPSTREPTVEVAHEALIRTWESLRTWINESREDLRVQRQVSSAVAEWITAKKDPGYLASGARLTQFQEWRDGTDLILNQDEQTYITTSIEAEDARKAHELAIARRVQNFQRASVVLGVMVTLAIVATLFFLNRATQAQKQVDSAFMTLEPAQAAVVEAQSLANDADTQVAVAGISVVTAQFAATSAGELVNTAQVQATSAQNDLNIAETQIGNAETQGAVVAQLTEIIPTIEAADERVSNLESQIQNVAATLTPAQATIDAAQLEVINAQSTVASAQGEVDAAQAEAEIAQTDVALAQELVFTAQSEAGVAQTDVAAVRVEAEIAQTDVVVALNDAETAQADANVARNEVQSAQTDVASSGETLTPVAATVIAGANQLNTQQADLSTAQVLAGNAETQIAVVVALTEVAPTIAAADERVANLELEIENVGLTLTPVQSTVEAAQLQIANVGLTLTPIQGEIARAQNQASTAQAQAESVQREADSISLAVNAEQAINVGNYDLALALTFESLNLDSGQARARRILNEVAFGTARMSFSDSPVSALSPDSRYFAVAEGNELLIWDVNTRTVIDRLTGHQGTILSVAFNATTTQLATGSQDATVRLWDITGWQSANPATLQHELIEHTGAVNVLRFGFNPNLPAVFSGSDDSRIIEWSTGNGSIIREYTGNSWAVKELRFVGIGGNFFTTVDANGTPILLYWAVGNVNPTYTEQNLIFETFNDDATRSIIGGTNGQNLEIYNSTRRSSVRLLNTRDYNWSSETATAFAFAPGGAEALIGIDSSQGENRLVLVNIANGEVVRTFSGQATQRVDVLSFNPAGNLALSADDNILILWDVASGTAIRTLAAHTDVIENITWSDDGRFAVSRSRDNNVRLWDITGADEALRDIILIDTTINRGKYPGFNARGDQVLAAAWVAMFNWDLQTGIRGETVSVGDEILNVLYHPVQSQAFTVSENVVISWNLDAGATGLIRRYGDNDSVFTGYANLSSDGTFLALDENRRILIYNLETGQRQTINKPNFEDNQVVTALAVSSDGQFVVTSTGIPFQQEASAGDIILWETSTGQELYRFPSEHNRTINSIAFSADGSRVLTASDDDTLILWDVTLEGAIVRRRFAGHVDDVSIGLFVPNQGQSERFVLSASDDRTMILWDIESGQGLRTFRGSPAAITGLNLSADGRQMVTSYGRLDESRSEPEFGSPETFIYVWELGSTDDLIEWTANNRFIRALTAAECEQYGISDCDGAQQIPENDDNTSAMNSALATRQASNSDSSSNPPTEPAATDVVDTGGATVINTGGGAINVRSSDSTNVGIVTSLQASEEALILGRSTRDTRWYQIRLDSGQIGWVRNDIVSVQGDVSDLPDIIPPLVVQSNPTAIPASNNTNIEPTVASASSQANLQITGLAIIPSPPQCLQAFTVQLNVRNTGTEATTAGASIFVFDRHVATASQGAQGSATVPVLAPSQDFVVDVSLTVSTFFAEEHQIVATVDSGATVPESNEGDNSFSSNYVLGSGSC